MKLNQSFIKRISKKYCPKKVKAEMDGVWKRTATLAMIKGQYFEWLLFGTRNREGEIPSLPRKNNGEKSVSEIRIDQQVASFKEICKKNDIVIYGTDRNFRAKMFDFDTFGTWDAYGLWKGKPVIIDIKLTQDITSSFGDFSWGDFESMDKIQAETYMESGLRLDGIKYDFLFMVFDHKKNPDYIILPVYYSNAVSFQVQQRLEETKIKLNFHEHNGWEAIGSHDECRDCPFSNDCLSYTNKKQIKANWMEKETSKKDWAKNIQESEEELNDIIASVFD